MGYYNLERAARDPHYRLMYEHQQRIDRIDSGIKATQAHFSGSGSTITDAGIGSSFSFAPSSASPSVSAGTGINPATGNAEATDEALAALGRFLRPPFFFGLFLLWFWQFYPTVASSYGRLGLWALLFAASLAFTIRYWRQVAVIAAGAALYYGAQWL